MADDGMRSLIRGHIAGQFTGYYIVLARACDPTDPRVVLHNQPLEVVRGYRKLVQDPK